jgi:hypothetical protein
MKPKKDSLLKRYQKYNIKRNHKKNKSPENPLKRK